MLSGSRRADEGGATPTAVFLLLFLVAVVLAGLSPLYASLAFERRQAEHHQTLEQLVGLVAEARELLEEDPTPESDSSFDPVWAFVTENQERLTLEDLSSRLNPNYTRVALFERTQLSGLFAEDAVPTMLQDRRVEEDRLFLSLEEGFGDLFDEAVLEDLFTSYSYVNINIADEETLERLYLARTGSPGGASAFRANVQALRVNRRIAAPEQLQNVVGTAFDEIFPLVTTEGEMNVHFIDPDTLIGVLSYPYGEEPIADPTGKAQRILEERLLGELVVLDLQSIIQPTERQLPVLEYLGTQTWFWRFRAEEGPVYYEEIVARLPEGPGEGAAVEEFRVVAIRRSH